MRRILASVVYELGQNRGTRTRCTNRSGRREDSPSASIFAYGRYRPKPMLTQKVSNKAASAAMTPLVISNRDEITAIQGSKA